jgi:hypothetical protein
MKKKDCSDEYIENVNNDIDNANKCQMNNCNKNMCISPKVFNTNSKCSVKVDKKKDCGCGNGCENTCADTCVKKCTNGCENTCKCPGKCKNTKCNTC